MKKYFRVRLGENNIIANECFEKNYIAVGYIQNVDLSNQLSGSSKEFTQNFIPIRQQQKPGTEKSAETKCRYLWTTAKGIGSGDIVLCPNGKRACYVGEIIGEYFYQPGSDFQHRRKVKWYPTPINLSNMTIVLQNTINTPGAVVEISKHEKEIETLICGIESTSNASTDEAVENPIEFELEKYLEGFLVQNWKQTELGKDHDIFEEDGELVGQQYETDTGLIDILAISKDKKTLLVVELKKGRASDKVVGQVQRYMGYVKEKLAEQNQQVKGVIIALEDDLPIKRALSVTNNIDFYKYQINFKLFKV